MKIVFYALTDEDLFLNRIPLARHLRDAGYGVEIAAPQGPYGEQILAEGFPVSSVVDLGRSVGGDVATTLSLARVLMRVKPDIVHTFGLRAALRGGLASRMRGISWVVHSLSVPHSDRYRHPTRILRAALIEAEVTFRRREDRDAFVARRYVRPEQTHVLRCSGVDLRDIPVTDEPARRPVAAILSPDPADFARFAEAALELATEAVDARFAVIGPARSSEMLAELRRLQELGIVEWWGEREDLSMALTNVHVICLPATASEHDHVIASAAGRPLVSATHPGVNSVLRSEESTIVLQANEAGELTRALRSLLADPETRKRMGRRARQVVESEFSARRVAGELMTVYERLFEKGRAV